jgi:hypothetical protein
VWPFWVYDCDVLLQVYQISSPRTLDCWYLK